MSFLPINSEHMHADKFSAYERIKDGVISRDRPLDSVSCPFWISYEQKWIFSTLSLKQLFWISFVFEYTIFEMKTMKYFVFSFLRKLFCHPYKECGVLILQNLFYFNFVTFVTSFIIEHLKARLGSKPTFTSHFPLIGCFMLFPNDDIHWQRGNVV